MNFASFDLSTTMAGPMIVTLSCSGQMLAEPVSPDVLPRKLLRAFAEYTFERSVLFDVM